MSDQPDIAVEEEESAVGEEKKSQRQSEWGQQFDMWLIRAAKRKQLVELLLAVPYPGITRQDNMVSCVPLRVDKYMVEVAVDNAPVWISKMYIIGCKPLGSKVRPEGETGNSSSD